MDKLDDNAENYLAKHRIPELFNELGAAIAYHLPEEINGFIIEQLERRESLGAGSGMLLFD